MTPRWRVAAVVLTVVLAAVACTTGRGGTRPPATANGSPPPPARAPDPDGTGVRSLPPLQGAGDPIDGLARVR